MGFLACLGSSLVTSAETLTLPDTLTTEAKHHD
jgi:hypothetical protein